MCLCTGVVATMPGVDDDELAGERRPRVTQLLRLAKFFRPSANRPRNHPVEFLEGLRTACPIRRHAHVALELAQGRLRTCTEDAVDATAVEAHLEQPVLQLHDVVTDER